TRDRPAARAAVLGEALLVVPDAAGAIDRERIRIHAGRDPGGAVERAVAPHRQALLLAFGDVIDHIAPAFDAVARVPITPPHSDAAVHRHRYGEDFIGLCGC